MPSPSVAERIAAFVAGTPEVPAADLDAIERSFLDTVGTMLAGRTSEHGRIMEAHAAREGGAGPCTIIGTGLRTGAPTAAMVNGTFGHSDDFDDMGGYGHPSVALVPAILAAAEYARRPIPGSALLLAYATGFELGVGLCQTGAYDQYDRCFHSTPVFGALAATCAAAKVLDLDETRTANALTLAASAAAGLGRSSGSMVKPLHAGHAAKAGVLAVLAARRGGAGSARAFEARGGFLEAFFGHRLVPIDRIIGELGNPYRAAKTIFLKRYPCCGSNHSALAGLAGLLEKHGLAADDIERVIVHEMAETSPVLRFPEPASGCEAKFSVHRMLGTLMVRGRVSVDDFTAEALADPAVAAAARKVRAEVLSRWDAAGADKRKGNPVTIHDHKGRIYRHFVPRKELPGGPFAPLSEVDLAAKFEGNARRSLAPEQAVTAGERWRALRECPDVAELIALVSR
ncbi:MmgE/PrpD family protein [Acrocarpospora macrocephala]|uniref:MmgE/PrpD family protein n=1 Tax=Acrocarpospora macrocephala TaxID=150177 RepID=A0A5M3WXV0_9ACTN|nr:MmgE/PrpD family protein [Acrocarpospora macrocephala]GES13092.1 hypothetical protein Amac_066890 [Acrocarpospora macrocephala]